LTAGSTLAREDAVFQHGFFVEQSHWSLSLVSAFTPYTDSDPFKCLMIRLSHCIHVDKQNEG
jgi:hypothetical protein